MSKGIRRTKGRSQMEKMAGERARFGRESHALGAMLRFDGIHFRRDFLVSLLPANHLPFTVAAWPGAFHRFYNPLPASITI
ncbi:Uncharacterised protein [Salmonella enterica subsp. enterica serovar Bovismorbificans]|uniref:Uncharacterized protein n=1 Tax=Salmonella enterica subsp. enterica serovar Bovismorbificans TaxID=58097 RepID=A0A655D468_SALET|nr:Uncharacterised protein [Salmonella enterica subsp. enterica serovar Bovismorbificans]